MQTVMGTMPPDGSQGSHSFFCIYDALTGDKVVCPESSSKFAFCSAIVDHTVPSDQTLWVFCSAWDRANHTYCPQPPPPPVPEPPRGGGVFATAEQRAQSSTLGCQPHHPSIALLPSVLTQLRTVRRGLWRVLGRAAPRRLRLLRRRLVDEGPQDLVRPEQGRHAPAAADGSERRRLDGSEVRRASAAQAAGAPGLHGIRERS